MRIAIQATSIILSVVCMGQAIKPGASKFDKVMYVTTGFAYLILSLYVQGVK